MKLTEAQKKKFQEIILKNVNDLESLIDKKNTFNKGANEVIKKMKKTTKGLNEVLKCNDITLLESFFSEEEIEALTDER